MAHVRLISANLRWTEFIRGWSAMIVAPLAIASALREPSLNIGFARWHRAARTFHNRRHFSDRLLPDAESLHLLPIVARWHLLIAERTPLCDWSFSIHHHLGRRDRRFSSSA
jgi:hypothetical protein